VVDTDTDVGTHTSLALGTAIHVAYRDEVNGFIKYARSNGTTWDIQIVGDEAGGWTSDATSLSLILNQSEQPRIATQSGAAFYYRFDGTNWRQTLIEQTNAVPGTSISAHMSPSDVPFICYAGPGEIHFVTSPLIPQIVSYNGAGNCSITLDAAGVPHVSFHGSNDSGSSLSDLMFATQIGGTWIVEDVDPGNYRDGSYYDYAGQFTSLAIAPNGTPHIAYYSSVPGQPGAGILRYARRAGDIWVMETVDATPGAGALNSLALDPAGAPHIAYYSPMTRELRIAHGAPSGWIVETIDASGDVGQYPSLAIDAAGHFFVSYYDATNGKLKLAF
jgi:hypothetical protein